MQPHVLLQERGKWKFDTEEIQWRWCDAGLENGARSHKPRSLEAGEGKETDSTLEPWGVEGRRRAHLSPWHLPQEPDCGLLAPRSVQNEMYCLSHQEPQETNTSAQTIPPQEFPGIQTWESSLPAKDMLKVVHQTGKEIPDGRLETQEEWRAKTVANAGVDLNALWLCGIIHVVVFFSNIWN